MRVLVCGGRDFWDGKLLYDSLNKLHGPSGSVSAIIHGDAAGADRLAGTWAQLASVPVERFPADWNKHGRGAGPIRNQEMIEKAEPDLVVAFPGGRGTADMVRRAEAAGIKVIHVSPEPSA